MKPTGGSVDEFVAAVTPETRRRDALTMIGMLREVSGLEPELWGTIVGFGACHYVYPTGTEGDMPRTAFAPRKTATVIYLDETQRYATQLAALGPHTAGAGCLYVKDLTTVDLDVLRAIVQASFDRVATGVYGDGTVTITR